jgi:hypothetical protein
MVAVSIHFADGPEADSCTAARLAPLFDHLAGAARMNFGPDSASAEILTRQRVLPDVSYFICGRTVIVVTVSAGV